MNACILAKLLMHKACPEKGRSNDRKGRQNRKQWEAMRRRSARSRGCAIGKNEGNKEGKITRAGDRSPARKEDETSRYEARHETAHRLKSSRLKSGRQPVAAAVACAAQNAFPILTT